MSDPSRRLEPGTGASGVLSFRLGDSQRTALDEIVGRTGRSRGDVMREAFDAFVDVYYANTTVRSQPGAA